MVDISYIQVFRGMTRKSLFLPGSLAPTQNRFHSRCGGDFGKFCIALFYISESADGLCCKLAQTCAKPRSLIWAFERGKQDDYVTARESILLIKKLGSGQFGEVWLGWYKYLNRIYIYMYLNLLG